MVKGGEVCGLAGPRLSLNSRSSRKSCFEICVKSENNCCTRGVPDLTLHQPAPFNVTFEGREKESQVSTIKRLESGSEVWKNKSGGHQREYP